MFCSLTFILKLKMIYPLPLQQKSNLILTECLSLLVSFVLSYVFLLINILSLQLEEHPLTFLIRLI